MKKDELVSILLSAEMIEELLRLSDDEIFENINKSIDRLKDVFKVSTFEAVYLRGYMSGKVDDIMHMLEISWSDLGDNNEQK